MQVFIIAALTADGFIAQNPEKPSTAWTSPEDKKFFMQKTLEAQVVVMGSQTYATIGRPLPNRLNIIYTKNPKKIKLCLNLQTTSLPPKKLIKDLQIKGFNQVAICGGASIYTLFLKSGVVNKLYLTLHPLLFGQGIKLFNKPLNQKLKLVKTTLLSPQTLLLEYNRA